MRIFPTLTTSILATKVQYAYTLLSGGANHSRLVEVVYPDGREIGYNYATGIDSDISRLTSVSDTGGTLESYTYMGLSTVVKRARPETGIDLSYIKLTG